MNQDSQSHRATPEQWKTVEIYAEDGSDEDNVTDSCLIELHSRIEALEAAQLEQAESHRFCTDALDLRVEALEAHDKEDASCWEMVRSGMHALRERVEALEAAPQDKLDRLIALERDDLTPDAAMTDYERVAANMASCPSIDRIPDFTGAAPAMTELRASSAEVRPAGGGWWRGWDAKLGCWLALITGPPKPVLPSERWRRGCGTNANRL
jgi:hypothetical protein